MRTLLAIGLLCTGCGGLDNRPLSRGALAGRLPGLDRERAFVAALGEPALLAVLDASGAFTFESLPAGEAQLLAVASDERAARLAVQVEAGKAKDLGEVPLEAAGRIEVRVVAPEHQLVSAGAVSVAGTPWQGLRLDGEGDCEVRGVPRGCWAVAVEVPGLGAWQREVCVEPGEARSLELLAERGEASEGCRVTGCQPGYSCEPDGACR